MTKPIANDLSDRTRSVLVRKTYRFTRASVAICEDAQRPHERYAMILEPHEQLPDEGASHTIISSRGQLRGGYWRFAQASDLRG